MYLLNNEDKVTLYDLEFNNRAEFMRIAKKLSSTITFNEFIKSVSEYEKMTEKGDKQPVYNPVYVGEKENDAIKVVEYTSKTPFTLAMVAYYAKNNWIQSLYSSMEYAYRDKYIYLKKIVDRMMSSYMLSPQLYMTKCNFDTETYRKHDMLFECVKKNSFSLEFLIEQYYPDLKAFIELIPYIDFVEEKTYNEGYFGVDSFEYTSAKMNTETMKQLGLTPNIRK